MPSDPRVEQALAAMARPIAEFRAIVQGALAQAETFLAAQAAGIPERMAMARAELGPFADGRLNPTRFAALFPVARRVDPAALQTLHQAVGVLRAMLERGDAAFVVKVPGGGELGEMVRQALAGIGGALGAASLVELVRGGRYQATQHDQLLAPVEFPAWGSAARHVAPPLVVTLDGGDLQAGALAPFTDGRGKIVLVVRGPVAPAPLARCITPGTLVLQTVDGSGLDRVAAFDGPAVAAVMPEGAAVFLHDPGAGREPWQRLTVHGTGELPKHAIHGMSAWQMAEDRTLLGDLARTPFAIPVRGGAATPAVGADDAVDRIAAWLLGQTGLEGS